MIVLDLLGKIFVVFQLNLNELVLPQYSRLRDESVNDLDFRIIHLWRRNLLRRYLSWYVAYNVTDVTVAVEVDAIPDMQPVRLDPRECQQNFDTTEILEYEASQL